jgi:hypothetical protein
MEPNAADFGRVPLQHFPGRNENLSAFLNALGFQSMVCCVRMMQAGSSRGKKDVKREKSAGR